MFCNYLHFSPSKRVDLTNSKGFSLIEVAVTIAIFGVLVAIAYPNLLRSRSNAKTRAVASDIFSSFRSARIEAVKRNMNVCLDFKTTGTYKAFVDDGAGGNTPSDCVTNGTEIFSKRVGPGNSIIADFQAGFNSQGRPLGGTLGSVTVQNNSNTNLRYRSSLSIAGRVDLQVTTDGGTNWD